MSDARVLVTGGFGFIAGHIIARLLDDGYQVRATLRSLHREAATVADCDYVLHVASPFPLPKAPCALCPEGSQARRDTPGRGHAVVRGNRIQPQSFRPTL